MFRNYLAAALRNLVRNRLYAAINIIGLAVGFAAALLIALFVRDELSYDQWIPGHESAFLLMSERSQPDRGTTISDATPPEFAGWLKNDYPDIEKVARLISGDGSVRHGDIESNDTYYWADPDFFDIVRLPAIAGDLTTALRDPNSIVITRKMAQKYFGRDDPIGESLELARNHNMTVRAVLEDLPPNSHLALDIVASGLASFSRLAHADTHPAPEDSYFISAHTYLRITSATAVQNIQNDLTAFFGRHKHARIVRGDGSNFKFPLAPLDSIHLRPGTFLIMKPRGDLATIYGVVGVGVLIIAIAIINFVNLMTAHAARRAIEVGIRKVSGAPRFQLIAQFIGESFIYIAVGVALGAGCCSLLLPTLNGFMARNIVFDLWRDPYGMTSLAAGSVAVAIIAGFYPGFVLSSYMPAAVLKKGDFRSSGSGVVRRSLVVLQFSVLIGLVVATACIYRQTSYAFKEGMRLSTDQALLIFADCKDALKNEIAKLPGVSAAACSSSRALNFGELNTTLRKANGDLVEMATAPIGLGFLQLYGLTPIAGRLFDEAHSADTVAFAPDSQLPDRGYIEATAIVLNETGARRLGFTTPADAVGKSIPIGDGADFVQPEVIGVVPDFAVDSIRRPVLPAIYYVEPRQFGILNVKLTGRSIPETLSAIDRVWKQLGEPHPIDRLFLSEQIQTQYRDIARQSQVFAIFASVAFFVAAIGLLGLSIFTAETRTKEIGIRKALGARTSDILRLLLWEFAKPVLWATVISWPVAYFVMRRWLQGFAYHITLMPWMFLAASALALVIAMLTVMGHALLIARAQPVSALRYE